MFFIEIYKDESRYNYPINREKIMLKLEKRNINLDVIRCIAVFSVISVHFFNNTEFYQQIVSGKRMYCMVIMRTFFMICVPLFLILTGFLMSKKELNRKYRTFEDDRSLCMCGTDLLVL